MLIIFSGLKNWSDAQIKSGKIFKNDLANSLPFE